MAADKIQLNNSVFTTINPRSLLNSAFKDIGDPGATVDADDRIFYNENTGALFYESNGSAVDGRMRFASLSG